MKVKSLLALTALAAATAAMANSVQSDGTLCRIEIQSSTTNTIVSIPLIKVAGSDTETTIPLTNLVLTTNLDTGDYILHQKTEGGWESWEVDNGAWKGITVSENSINSTVGSDKSFSLGDAFWLVRKAPTDSDGKAKSFYLYGQVATAACDMPEIPASDKRTADTFIMMGNTNLADVAVKDFNFKGSPVVGDRILVPVNTGLGVRRYNYGSTGWTQTSFSKDNDGVIVPTITSATDLIPAGQGFWYMAVAPTSSSN